MSNKLNSIDDYERFLFTTIENWTAAQRLALAAAMAERWFPVYEAFSIAEEWGDPTNMRHILNVIWQHLSGKLLSSGDLARYTKQVEDSTPHMDDFDAAEAALATCIMFSVALDCCQTTDNLASAMQAIISGFEAVAPSWEMDLEEQPRIWQQIMVRREFKKQLELIRQIGAITDFDDATIETLRRKLTQKAYLGEASPTSKSTKGPVTITNQTAFEQYRNLVEIDIKSNKSKWWKKTYPPGSTTWVLMHLAAWMGRYSRRRDTINGNYGKLADVIAQQILVVRQKVHDGQETTIPQWDLDTQEMVNMMLRNSVNGFDVAALDQPHGYGPSLRTLWGEAQRQGYSDMAAWEYIITWARHRPAAWDVEDHRKKQGLAYTAITLGNLLARELTWQKTGDPDYPWATEVNEQQWQIRLNDFPDDLMYCLLIDGQSAGDFHDWPQSWKRA